ncbi:Outer membrane receptor proteins, mostly Fe transport [Tenacibaculum sp. MAR_2009_124]|uniref:TonB-dependent receptor n=1 Tax=Tenacibaculum sp. MAR_2009_124 TaxID=1250059 RepID=UPI00089BDDB0|nr:TonB-dependent receptor plug domain-containing protein [Tenacibaculum sp. MAR_2009_124]SEC24060.1 Outer membrane receptor proteins, mostly Fe transport [Tenacibaculum sp. MAR_2009_124]
MFINTKLASYFLLILSLLVWNVSSQNKLISLKGELIDENGTSLKSISIYLVELNITTKSNSAGSFEFKNIPPAIYTLIIESDSHELLTKKVSLKTQNQEIQIVLKRNEKLKEVIVLGKKKNQFKSLGYELEILNIANELNNTKTLNQILEQQSSINVRQSGGLGSRVNYSINGLSEKSVRFFIDGIPMEFYGASFSINTIPISVIDKIEIYKGITPIYLSNDNLGGAINLITKKVSQNLIKISYSFGSFNTHTSSVYTNINLDKKGAYINAFGFYNYSDNNYEIWGDNVLVTDPETFNVTRNNRVERFHDAFQSKGIKASFGIKNRSWTDHFETGLILTDFDKEIQHGPTMEIPFGEATYSQKNGTAYLRYSKKNLLNKKLGIQLFAGYSDRTRVHIDTTKNIYSWNGKIIGQRVLGGEQYGVLTQNTLKKKTFIQKLSADYRLNNQHKAYFTSQIAFVNRTDNDPTITNKNEAYWAPQHFNKNTFGLALDSKWLHRKLSTSFFIKNHSFNAKIKTTEDGQLFKNSNADANFFGFGFSSSYKINQLLILKTSFERANRLPEETEILGDGVNILSTDQLKAEQSFNYNIGVQHQLLLNNNSTLTYNLFFFRRDVDNFIKLWQKDDSAFVYINFDNIDIHGFDAELKYKWKNKFQVNYAISRLFPIIKSRLDSDGNKNLLFNSELPNTLLFKSTLNTQVNFENTFKTNDALSVKWASNFVDSFFVRDNVFGADNKDEIPQQLSHNVGVNYSFPNKKISIGLDCNNIFDAQLFDNFAIQKPGRAFFTKINWSI